MDIKASMVYTFFDKQSLSSGFNNNEIKQTIQLAMNSIYQLLEILKKEKCILHLEITVGVQI